MLRHDGQGFLSVSGLMDLTRPIPVCRKTRWRILRMAAESSTTRTSTCIRPLHVFIGRRGKYIRGVERRQARDWCDVA